ncbi:DUF4159 domain-containing protein [candidate division KSB1 bacterium]|nr:DUF4159 domain-containing protein [candidate division KSB1 bacterium]
MNRHICIFLLLALHLFFIGDLISQTDTGSSAFIIGRLKYSGGGDWYNDPSTIPNLLAFLGSQTNIYVGADEKKIQIMDEDLFSIPVLFLTGHGKIHFSEEEAARLRKYLLNGGFLYADDDYGMDRYFRQQMKNVFPDKQLIELPASHPIYRCHFNFPNGLPKIHEHDPGPGFGYGIFHEGRMIVYYTFNTNISDGWVDQQVHGDPPEVREQALRMGTNIMVYALTR